MTRRDPVTPAIREAVLRRDGYRCMAPVLDENAGPCHDQWGREVRPGAINALTVDHVGEGRMGKAAKSDADHLVALCWGHHLGSGEHGFGGSIWATSHRPELREYLAGVAA